MKWVIYQDVLDQKLTKEFSNVHINYRSIKTMSFLLNKNDSINLVNILKSSDVVNIFSTMNIDTAI